MKKCRIKKIYHWRKSTHCPRGIPNYGNEKKEEKHHRYHQLAYAYYDLDDNAFFASTIDFLVFSITAGLVASPMTSSSSSPLSRDGRGVGEIALA
jgi:hypothetical protein